MPEKIQLYDGIEVKAQIQLDECGCCGQYHPTEFQGDCRDDEQRFNSIEAFIVARGAEPADVVVWALPDDPDDEPYSIDASWMIDPSYLRELQDTPV